MKYSVSMDELSIKPLGVNALIRYGSWFDQRAASSILFKEAKHQELFRDVSEAWAGVINDEVVAVATLSLDTMRHGHLDFAVNPSDRRSGIGSSMIGQVLALPTVTNLVSTQVVVEPDNVAGQKILHKFGYVQIGFSQENLLIFEKR